MIETSSDLPRRSSAIFGSPWKSSTIFKNFGKCSATWSEMFGIEESGEANILPYAWSSVPSRPPVWFLGESTAPGRSTYYAGMSPTSFMAYVSEKTHSFFLSLNSPPFPNRLQIKITSLLGTVVGKYRPLVIFLQNSHSSSQEQPSRFVIRYVYIEHYFCLAILLFFNYYLI